MSDNPVSLNNELITSVKNEAVSIAQQTINYLITQSDTQTSYTWDTTNGINSDIFDTGSTITLYCQNNTRHLVGYLKTKEKDGSNNNISFASGTPVSVLPNTSFSTSVLRYTDGFPGSWLIEIDGNGIRMTSTALVTLTGVRTIVFSYTYLATATETEVHTTEVAQQGSGSS